MTPAEPGWSTLKSVVAEALELPPAARDAHLEAQLTSPSLRAEAVRLLHACEAAASSPVLELGAVQFAAGLLADVHESSAALIGESPVVYNARYELGAPIGHGGMGVVHRAIDRQNPDRPLAIKRIRSDRVSESSLSLFKAEFKAMAEMRHPNIARVYDFERIQGSDDYLFTMEYVDGTNIFDATLDATPETALGLVVETCRALSYVHSRKLIHLDLKPRNIMVDRTGTVKVLDFGLVGSRTPDSVTTYACTPAYAAPERLDAALTVDHRADLYSLGVTWFQLLCRRLPFESANLVDLLRLQQTAPLHFDEDAISRIPAWMRGIIERLCAKDPADRFRSGNAVIEAINAAGGRSFEIETSATRDSYCFAGQLVGRREQLDELSDFMNRRLDDAAAPIEPVFLVAGPSGGGKSRIMLELRHRAQMSRAVFIEADCYEGSLSEYEPVITAVGYTMRLAESVGASDLLDRFAPSLALLDRRFGRESDAPVAGVDNPDAARVALIAHICDFLVAVAERVPYVVYVNDLQWARAETLDVLLNLSRLVAVRERGGMRVRLAVFGSYRDDEVVGRPIERWLCTLHDNHELRSVRLEPLVRNEVASLLGSMLGIDELPDRFVDRVARETAGNPLFISEVMRSLVERGSVYLEGGRWSADRPIGVLEIPPTMATLFERRVARLDEREQDVLKLVAAYGRPMPLWLMATVTGLDGDTMHDIVLGLLRRQMLSRGTIGGQSCCWASHDRIRELVYARTDRETRLQLHRALAEALEARTDRYGGTPLVELARQWWAAEDRDKALVYCISGGREAKRRHALETGIELLDHALELLPPDGSAQRATIEEDLAEMLALAGDFDRATVLYDGLLPKLATVMDRARVMRQLGSIACYRGNAPVALQNLWKALGLLGDVRPRSRAGLLAKIGLAMAGHFLLRFAPSFRRLTTNRAVNAAKAECYSALVYPGYHADPLECLLAVLRSGNHAMKVGDGPQLSLACSHLGFLFYGLILNRFATAAEFNRRALSIADTFELPLHRAYALQATMFLKFLEGEWDAVCESALESAALFREYGDMYCVGSSYCLLLLGYRMRGMLEAARRAAQEGLEIIERVGALVVSTPVSMKHGMLLADLGDERGLPKVLEALRTADRIGDPLQRSWVRLFLGHCYFAQGELEHAVAYLESCVQFRREFRLGADFLGPIVHPLLARAYIDLARRTTDPSTRQDSLRRAKRHAAVGLRSMKRRATYRAAAILAMAECRWEDGSEMEARALFDRSIAFAEQQGSRMMLADAHYELGRRLRDSEGARRHLQVALELYDACGAVTYVQCARRVLTTMNPTVWGAR